MKIGVLTGGGDVPGLNPCIRAVTLGAADRGWEVVGFKRGWCGLIDIDPDDLSTAEEHTLSLDKQSVRGIDRYGGTILHTSRTDPRTVKSGDKTDHVIRVMEKMGVDVMVTLGGDGTLRFSAHLASMGVPVVSIPKTMDNDVFGTDYCIGFSTAVSRSVEAINALRTTAASHERIAVIELFGRRSGETALLAGFLAQVDRTAIAESPIDLDALLPLLDADKRATPSNYSVLVVSEGARLKDDGADAERNQTATAREGENIGPRIAREIEKRGFGGTISQQLAYLMRSGAPDALDRMVGFAFGGLAVEMIERKTTGRMVALKDGRYTHVPADTLLRGTKGVDVAALYDAEAYRPRIARVEGKPMFLY